MARRWAHERGAQTSGASARVGALLKSRSHDEKATTMASALPGGAERALEVSLQIREVLDADR